MKFKYFYQQLLSHISVIVVAFLIVALLFTQFVEQYMYENKTEELMTYGETILTNLTASEKPAQQLLQEYGSVLKNRPIHFSLFNEQSEIIYASDGKIPDIHLDDADWIEVTKGNKVVVKKDFEQFKEGATYVILPYFQGERFVGGILLAAPISGLSNAIDAMNASLWKSVYIAVATALLLSAFLARFHVRRINVLKRATSAVAKEDYSITLPTSTVDEIGELAVDFQHMVDQLEQSANEIERLENRRRQFMADVSHELKTPLTTIRGMIEGLENNMIPASEQGRALHLAEQEAKRLIRLVNENLDYEKIRSNQVQLQIEKVRVEELYSIVKEQLHDLAKKKGNDIMIDVPSDMYVEADMDRLLQIVMNIVKNSMQFTENGVITLQAYEEAASAVLVLKDTGIGMDTKEVEHIWERFYKADISRTTNPYGEFGLGLSIVKQLVTLHDGTIDVQSKKGEGTVFTITLPKSKD